MIIISILLSSKCTSIYLFAILGCCTRFSVSITMHVCVPHYYQNDMQLRSYRDGALFSYIFYRREKCKYQRRQKSQCVHVNPMIIPTPASEPSSVKVIIKTNKRSYKRTVQDAL